ncbi:hypothetical protein CDD83_2029 [Cordyceps sp. RAO-2017]|nr:hypothetical protein CDD83_2029 [Cordyceps sp. RAO-2017]
MSDVVRARSPSARPSQTSGEAAAAIQDDQDEADATPESLPVGAARPTPASLPHSGIAASIASRLPDFEVILEDGDADNPKSWPIRYRGWCIVAVSLSTWVVTLLSTSYSASLTGLADEFGATTTLVALGMTTYLLGLAVGTLILAPMGELYGRRVVYIVCLSSWALLNVPCGLAHSLTAIIVIRFFGACLGAVTISNGPGTVVDVSHPEYLARAMSLFGFAPFNGPVTAPIIGGFVFQYMGWRWANWIVLIIAGVCIALVLTVEETYAPTILKRKAARLRRQTGDPRWWCRYDQRRVSTLQLLRVNLSRPFILFATEPILWFMNLWISIAYSILYFCFIAYPVVFSQHRG